jgi:hypothetical protein
VVPAVEQARDIRVIEAGEDLPFRPEAPDDGVGIHPALEDLQRDAFVKHGVVSHR